MKKKTKTILIPIAQWQSVHPVGVKCHADSFYADLARFLANAMKTAFGTEHDITDDCFALTAIDLAAYLEDKVNGLNLWNSFISLYRKKYSRQFPFYNIEGEEMLLDEPNFSDVRYILWHDLNLSNPATLVNPLNPFIEKLVEPVFQTLCEAYENAPESPEFKAALFTPELYYDPIILRNICGWLTGRAYLTRILNPDTTVEPVTRMFSQAINGKMDKKQLAYTTDAYLCFNSLIGPMQVAPAQWLAEMLFKSINPELHIIAKEIEQVRSLTLMPYCIETVDAESMTVKNIHGETITVNFDTLLPEVTRSLRPGHLMTASLFFYHNDWHVNGMASFSSTTIDFQPDIDDFKKRQDETRSNYELYLNLNGGTPIGVAADWNEFVTRFKLENASEQSNSSDSARMRKATEILYFINPNGNISLLPGAARYVCLPDNKFYNSDEAKRFSAPVLLDVNATPQMRQYIIDNNLIPDARLAGPLPDDEAKAWFKENADFLNRALNTNEIMFNFE